MWKFPDIRYNSLPLYTEIITLLVLYPSIGCSRLSRYTAKNGNNNIIDAKKVVINILSLLVQLLCHTLTVAFCL